MSAQAVGGAVGKNEISIIVPCHRVVVFLCRNTALHHKRQRRNL